MFKIKVLPELPDKISFPNFVESEIRLDLDSQTDISPTFNSSKPNAFQTYNFSPINKKKNCFEMKPPIFSTIK